MKAIKNGVEYKENMRQKLTGKLMSEEAKIKMSIAKLGGTIVVKNKENGEELRFYLISDLCAYFGFSKSSFEKHKSKRVVFKKGKMYEFDLKWTTFVDHQLQENKEQNE